MGGCTRNDRMKGFRVRGSFDGLRTNGLGGCARNDRMKGFRVRGSFDGLRTNGLGVRGSFDGLRTNGFRVRGSFDGLPPRRTFSRTNGFRGSFDGLGTNGFRGLGRMGGVLRRAQDERVGGLGTKGGAGAARGSGGSGRRGWGLLATLVGMRVMVALGSRLRGNDEGEARERRGGREGDFSTPLRFARNDRMTEEGCARNDRMKGFRVRGSFDGLRTNGFRVRGSFDGLPPRRTFSRTNGFGGFARNDGMTEERVRLDLGRLGGVVDWGFAACLCSLRWIQYRPSSLRCGQAARETPQPVLPGYSASHLSKENTCLTRASGPCGT